MNDMVHEPRSSAACLNCGAPLTGRFCAACGQRDVPPYPSLRELVVDALWELSGWDGRFAATVRALVRHPGMLTREFLEGRRARYVSPVRLYLMASLAYFVLAATSPNLERPSRKGGVSVGAGVNVDLGRPRPASRPERVAAAAVRAQEDDNALSPAEKAAALKEIAGAPAVMRPFLRRAVGDPAGLKRDIVEALPRMLFVLLPMFAAIVALFYRGRRYPEHLYFAVHLHAFVFLALAIPQLLSFTRVPLVADAAGIAAAVWIFVYATLAFRRVYGEPLGRTLAKEVGIAALYWLASLVAFILTLYWVSIAG